MLPRVTITPDLSSRTGSISKHFSKPASDAQRKQHRPVRSSHAFAPSRPSAAQASNVAPLRRSLERPTSELAAPSIQSYLDADSAGSSADLQQQALSVAQSHTSSAGISHSTSASSLSSESELSLLLNGADLSRPGTTTINIGSIPIAVPIAYLEVPAAEAAQQAAGPAACGSSHTAAPSDVVPAAAAAGPEQASAAAAAKPSKLKASSAEFFPQAYLAAAATALAAQTISSQAQYSSAPPAAAAADEEASEHEQQAAVVPAQQQEVPQQEEQQPAEAYWQAAAQPQQEMAMQPWQPQQQWQQHPQQPWQPQQPMPLMFFPVPVPFASYMMPAYPFAYHQHQQMQMHPMMGLPAPAPAAADSSSAAATNSAMLPPPSPAPSLPADTSSLLSTPSTPAAAGWALANSSSLYSSTGGSRPGSSASSIASGYSSSRAWQQHGQQQQALRDAGTVTVSALSCVKDAAGALAKVVSRHGSCLLLSLSRAGDQAAQATHVAAKSLAVARFYVNAHMAAAGSAGVDAAAVLTGLEPATPTAATAAADDEVVFMPYTRNNSSSSYHADAEPALGFMVAKACAKDLPVQLPPPVGIPACMADRQQQGSSSASSSSGFSAAAGPQAQSRAPLLKAGANTDVNKLSNAIIHNILGQGHVALQLAGAAACHVAMKALIKARSRLQRKFDSDIVATASFANEDTSSSIGRSTVFLRLDVMRSSLLANLAAGAVAAGGAVSRAASEVAEGVAAAAATAQQEQVPAGAAV